MNSFELLIIRLSSAYRWHWSWNWCFILNLYSFFFFRSLSQDWHSSYEGLADMIVPKSSQ